MKKIRGRATAKNKVDAVELPAVPDFFLEAVREWMADNSVQEVVAGAAEQTASAYWFGLIKYEVGSVVMGTDFMAFVLPVETPTGDAFVTVIAIEKIAEILGNDEAKMSTLISAARRVACEQIISVAAHIDKDGIEMWSEASASFVPKGQAYGHA